MLRAFLVAVGVLFVAGGLLTMRSFGALGWVPAGELLFGGVFLLFAIFGEARRYGAKKTANAGPWQATGERFTDPTSGKLMEVCDNPQTGQREYQEVNASPPAP